MSALLAFFVEQLKAFYGNRVSQTTRIYIQENAGLGTPIVTGSAKDLDEGEFGRVVYMLEGTHQEDFSIGNIPNQFILN